MRLLVSEAVPIGQPADNSQTQCVIIQRFDWQSQTHSGFAVSEMARWPHLSLRGREVPAGIRDSRLTTRGVRGRINASSHFVRGFLGSLSGVRMCDRASRTKRVRICPISRWTFPILSSPYGVVTRIGLDLARSRAYYSYEKTISTAVAQMCRGRETLVFPARR